MEPSNETDILLPRGYLSWSALDLWEKNPERFKREYFEQQSKLDTKYLRFGKGFAKSIEDGSVKQTLPELIVYKEIEYQIKDVKINEVPILSFIDSYDPDEHVFREYKTGKNPWNQVKVQKHGQLVFYAVGLKAKHGNMPAYCDLDWIETKEQAVDVTDFWSTVDKKLSLTGKITSFRRYFDMRELERMEERIERVAKEISKAYHEFIKSL